MSNLISADELNAMTGRWDPSTLPPNIRIGAGCVLENRASFSRFRSTRDPGLVLGDRVTVYAWTAFSIDPEGSIVVGNDSVLVGAMFMCAERIEIGRAVVVSYNVTIADSDFHPLDPDARRRDSIASAPGGDRSTRPAIVTRPVVIEDEVWIGIGAIVLKGVRIGRGARIGAGAVVTRDVPEGATLIGNPGRLVERGSE
jgi:acetyltransferase-like isoleucine patch superfamily enzyme